MEERSNRDEVLLIVKVEKKTCSHKVGLAAWKLEKTGKQPLST